MHVICITDWPGENLVTQAVNNAQYFVDWFLPFLVFVLAGVSCWHDNPMICNVPCRPGEVADMMTGRFAMSFVSGAKSLTQRREDWLDLHVFVLVERCRRQDEMKIYNVSSRRGKFAVTKICNVSFHHVSSFAPPTRRSCQYSCRHVGDFTPPTRNKCKSLCRCVIDFSLSKSKNGRNQPPYNTVITYNPKSFHFCACSDLSNCLGKWCGVVFTFVFTRDSLTKWFTFL